MSSSTVSVNDIVQSAISSGSINQNAADVIIDNLDDITIAGCDGLDIDEIDSEEVTLVSVMIDASWSMAQFSQDVIDAYNNHFIGALQKAKNASSILVSTWIFSAQGSSHKDYCRLLHGWTDVPNCPKLDASSYSPDGGTPLWEAVTKGLSGMVSYGQTLRDNGTRTKCIAIVLSDGEENSSNVSASSVRTLTNDLLHQEIYVLAYAFFGNQADGDTYAKEIGFPQQHRISAAQSGTEIRRVFGTASASVISTSQAQVSAGSLSANQFFVNP